MNDKVYPASKPATGVPVSDSPATITGKGSPNGAANTKAPVSYIPPNRPVYRPNPYTRVNQNHKHHRSRPSCCRVCCCCCFWSILIILILALMAAISATAMYAIYRPRAPSFSVPVLRVAGVNLTTSESDSSISHLSSLFNFTLIAANPNSHLTFSYDPFTVNVIANKSGAMLGNGTVPAFFSDSGNSTSFPSVIAAAVESRDLYPNQARDLKSDLTRSRVTMRITMKTTVTVRMGKLKSKGIEINVLCEGFEGTIPKAKGKSPSIATSETPDCKVQLSAKLMRWSIGL